MLWISSVRKQSARGVAFTAIVETDCDIIEEHSRMFPLLLTCAYILKSRLSFFRNWRTLRNSYSCFWPCCIAYRWYLAEGIAKAREVETVWAHLHDEIYRICKDDHASCLERWTAIDPWKCGKKTVPLHHGLVLHARSCPISERQRSIAKITGTNFPHGP